MDKRYTRHRDEYACRAVTCEAEDWMQELYGYYPEKNLCDTCPFIEMINHLANLEDENEELEDDNK
jgi:hypothetical protein